MSVSLVLASLAFLSELLRDSVIRHPYSFRRVFAAVEERFSEISDDGGVRRKIAELVHDAGRIDLSV